MSKGDGLPVRCVHDTPRTLADLNYMQEITPQICSNTPEHYEKQLKDTRDGQSYRVFKAKDGNCWMGDNLNLDLKTSSTYTKSDTDLNSKDTWTPSINRLENLAEWPKADSPVLGASYLAPNGMLYDFYATSAGSSAGLVGTNTIIPDSICPKGWRLPAKASDGAFEFNKLLLHYNHGNQILSAPLSIKFGYIMIPGQAGPIAVFADHLAIFWFASDVRSDRWVKDDIDIRRNDFSIINNGASILHGQAIRCLAR